jgi:hypothetical protein
MPEPKLRNVNADRLKAVNDAIAVRVSVGAAATPHLLAQKAALEAALGIGIAPPPAHVDEPAPEPAPVFEHAAADELPETAAPRRPGRPRKPSDDEDSSVSPE